MIERTVIQCFMISLFCTSPSLEILINKVPSTKDMIFHRYEKGNKVYEVSMKHMS